MTQNNQTFSVETLIAASLQHGKDSEPDHEVGDLQEYLRAAWSLMPLDQRIVAISQPRIANAIDDTEKLNKKDIETLLSNGGIEVIFDIFSARGIKDVNADEVTDLRETLKSFWDALPQDFQRSMLELNSTKETFENATLKPLSRYLVSLDWKHIFEGRQEQTTRWIYDRHEDSIVQAQVWSLDSSRWIDLGKDSVADLLQDINDNDVISESGQWVFYQSFCEPTWQGIDDRLDFEQQTVTEYPELFEKHGVSNREQITAFEDFLDKKDLRAEFTAYVLARLPDDDDDDDAKSTSHMRSVDH